MKICHDVKKITPVFVEIIYSRKSEEISSKYLHSLQRYYKQISCLVANKITLI